MMLANLNYNQSMYQRTGNIINDNLKDCKLKYNVRPPKVPTVTVMFFFFFFNLAMFHFNLLRNFAQKK